MLGDLSNTINHLKSIERDSTVDFFSGVKGSVSIATILLLPKHSVIGELGYSLILFTVGAVTLMSF